MYFGRMIAIICRREWLSPRDGISLGPQIAVFVKSFSSEKSSPGVRGNDSQKSLTVSYLINSCGLSSVDALSVSKKLRIKSHKNPDAVLELLRNYGFTNAHITRLVVKRPKVLLSSPEKTLLPKLEFFRSIGTPLPILAERLSFNTKILNHSVTNVFIPWYNTLKGVFQSDKNIYRLLFRATRSFESVPSFSTVLSNIALLRKQGLPDSSIALVFGRPSMMSMGNEILIACIDRAAEMGFDRKKTEFARAILVFGQIRESTLKYKMDVYKRCGWSDHDIKVAFLKNPMCMLFSEKKIMATMDFLVNNIGLDPVDVAQRPMILSYSFDKRMKPRFLVARILSTKGLKKMLSIAYLLAISEEKFVKEYIVDYQEDIPQLLDIYRGKLSLNDVGFSQDVIEKIQFDFKHDDDDDDS